MATSGQWKVLPHGAVEPLAENLWRVEGQLERMPIRRVMTLARLANGDLVIHNAIALEDDLMARIEGWGRPAWLIVPNGYHRLDAPAMKARYPQIKVLCARGSRKKVEDVVKVDGTYEDFPKDDTVSLETLAGVGDAEGVMTVRSKDGTTLVFNDVIFNMPHQAGSSGFVLRLLGSSGGPRVSRIAKLFLVRDKAAFASHLRRLAATPDLRRVIVSHYEMMQAEPARALETIAASLA